MDASSLAFVAKSLTLDKVAEELGVHYQTVYRWVRSGRLPALKVGGRYVVAKADVGAMRKRRATTVRPPAPGPRRLEGRSEAMQAALLAGDETAAQGIVRRLVNEGAPVTAVIQEVLVPPLVHIGQAWRDGELGIYVEHRASAIVERILGGIAPNPRGRRRGTAVVAALAGDDHALPTAMATAALREDHWHVEHLGADLPVDELVDFARSPDIDLAVISATGAGRREVALAVRDSLEREGIPTLVGGGGRTLADLQSDARATLDR